MATTHRYARYRYSCLPALRLDQPRMRHRKIRHQLSEMVPEEAVVTEPIRVAGTRFPAENSGHRRRTADYFHRFCLVSVNSMTVARRRVKVSPATAPPAAIAQDACTGAKRTHRRLARDFCFRGLIPFKDSLTITLQLLWEPAHDAMRNGVRRMAGCGLALFSRVWCGPYLAK